MSLVGKDMAHSTEADALQTKHCTLMRRRQSRHFTGVENFVFVQGREDVLMQFQLKPTGSALAT